MKRLAFVLALLVLAMPCSATIALVQKTTNAATSTSPFTVTINGTTAGNLIEIDCGVEWSIVGTLSINDGTFSATTARNNGGQGLRHFYRLSGAGGNLSLQVSGTNIAHLYCVGREYSYAGTLSFDAEAGFTSSSTASPASNTPTISGSNDLFVGAMVDFNASGGGCGTGWTTNCAANTDQGTMVVESEDKLNQSSALAAPFTLTSSQSDWAADVIAFSESGGAAAKTCTLSTMGAGPC